MNEQIYITEQFGAICPVCRGESCEPLRPYRGHSEMLVGLDLVRCGQCELVFADPMPSEEQLSAYNSSYFDNAHGGLNMHPDALLFFSGIALLRLDHVMSYCREQDKVPHEVLEVGPGHGYFYEHLRDLIPNCRYTALESDSRCHDRLRELGALVYEDFSQLQENSYDLLVMSHVLEHSAKPDEFLRSAVSFLKPGGVVFIEVPCRDYEFKDEDEPHLLFFDKQPMNSLLERLTIDNIRLSYHGQEISKIRKQGSLRERLKNKWRGAQRRLGIDLSRKSPLIADRAMWSVLRSYEPHLQHDRPSWWLRALGCRSSHTQ
jgi:SAM-dependent methyltransferase